MSELNEHRTPTSNLEHQTSNLLSIHKLQPVCPLLPIGPFKYSKPNLAYTFNACFSSGIVSKYTFLYPVSRAKSKLFSISVLPSPVPLACGNKYIFTNSQVSAGKPSVG